MAACGLVIDYSGSMPQETIDILQRIMDTGCLPLACDVSLGVIIPYYKDIIKRSDINSLIETIVERMREKGPKGRSPVVEGIASVLTTLSSGPPIEKCFILVVTDAYQQIPVKELEVDSVVCSQIEVLVVLVKGRPGISHSPFMFAEELAKILGRAVAASDVVVYGEKLRKAVESALENDEESLVIITGSQGRAIVRILPSDTLMNAIENIDPCTILGTIA